MPARLLLASIAAYLLYFHALDGVGLVGPDEPRYASIGREMARSGDWITPKLWGEPWFEKPALLYWMIAAGNLAGLGPELAPRLPVALVSVAFLFFYRWLLAREFGARPAWVATLMLATSAGWLAFSHAAVTDLPMSAAFAAAMLLALGRRRGEMIVAGALVGLAVLAKGLVPLVLALPLVWWTRERWRDLTWPAAALLATALPWYVLAVARHGRAFVDEFFLRHHFGRFATPDMQHVQPWWYYFPVLAAALFPWTPVLILCVRKGLYSDGRRRLLAAWVVFGFLFFSIATNKLPGYLLPLLPAVCALAGLAIDEARETRWVLAAAGALLALTPAIAAALPRAVESGLSRVEWQAGSWTATALLAAIAPACFLLRRADRATVLVAGAAVAGVLYVKLMAFPKLDAAASARSLAARGERLCAERLTRSQRYGVSYYSGAPLAECDPPAALLP